MKSTFGILLTTILCLVTTNSNGQSDSSRSFNIPLEDLMKLKIISASRSEENITKIPSSVTVIKGDVLEDMIYISNNFSFILGSTVPGLGTTTNMTSTNTQTLRGRNVLVLIDGVPQSTPLRNAGRDINTIDPTMIERVEIVKGATAIYGNGADGGLINYITKKTDVFARKLNGKSLLGGHGNVVGINGSLGYRIGQTFQGNIKKVSYLLSGIYNQTGVYKDAEGKIISPDYGLGETKQYNAFLKINYALARNHRLELLDNLYSSNQHSRYIESGGVYGQTANVGIRGERPGVKEGTRYNHNISLRYFKTNLIRKTGLDISLYLQHFETIFLHSDIFYGGGQSKINSHKKGLRINIHTPFRIGWVMNGNVTYGVDVLNDVTLQKLVDGRGWVPPISMTNLAPYLQLKTDFFRDLILKTGVRAENVKTHIDDFNTIAAGPDNAGSVAVKGGTLNFEAIVYNAGLRYSRFKIFNPFVSFSQSFSVYDLGRILRTAKENTIDLLETKPIIVDNYEVGFNSYYKFLNFSAVYFISASRLGANIVAENGVFVPERLPEKLSGYELTLDIQPISKIAMGGTYSYVEGRADINNNERYNDSSDVYISGLRIAPPKGTAYIRYANKKIRTSLYWVYSGSRNRFQPNSTGVYSMGEGPVTSYNVFNACVSYKFTPKFISGIGVENLFNNYYFNTRSMLYATNNEYTSGNGMRMNVNMQYTF